ncbi:SprT-like family-domain-containing protein [Ampelomyces quisqualis]|uniref:SprT-like family-domain-containing protein n=1 Tax=Ampelomyces quisqualis TaxID=50730 RepID=A0A6A5QX54_AMPQU|nr:SprT-like family-domain-containing protein [Ampelomyces quisqualis]
MARLRKPSPNEATVFVPPSASGATRSSPRKATRSVQYAISSDEEEEALLISKRSAHDLRCNAKTTSASNTLTPRKQRILRPVKSNSRLLRKLSNESLACSERKPRERRIRSETTDIDVSRKRNLLYTKTLAKSMANKQARTAQIGTAGDAELHYPPMRREKENVEEEVLGVEAEEDVETSLWCGDEEVTPQEKEATSIQELSDEEDDDPIVAVRHIGQRPNPRRIISDSEEDSEQELSEAQPPKLANIPKTSRPTQQEPAEEDIVPLTSLRPPHRKGHSTISNWAQEVIDLTSSPEPAGAPAPPPLLPPTRVRSASFASCRPPTSSSQTGLAILTYSPTPTKLRSPCKAPPIARPATPTLGPPSPSKLVSPSKKQPSIPNAPHLRPSLDAFWDPEVVNDWNEKHSPSKPLVSPRKQKWRDDIVKMMKGIELEDDDSSNSDAECPSPTTSPRKKNTTTTKTTFQPRSPIKKPIKALASTNERDIKALRAQRKAFSAQKHALAESFVTTLDSTICASEISTLSASTGGIKLIWSRTLKTTAGRANWRREQLRLRTGPLASDFSTSIRHHCSIELAEKIIDDEERLYNVLAHEFCHLATFMISGVRNNPHGKEFKTWGARASAAFADQGVQVTTKHSYAIEYKFVWECVDCAYQFKRHSKSIDTNRHSCGKCKGPLAQVKPTPRAAGKKDAAGKGGEYQAFVKEHFGRVKAAMGARGEDVAMGKVVEQVAREYRDMKAKEKEVGLEQVMEGLKL